VNLLRNHVGFQTDRLVTFQVNPGWSGYSPAAAVAFFRDLQQPLAATRAFRRQRGRSSLPSAACNEAPAFWRRSAWRVFAAGIWHWQRRWGKRAQTSGARAHAAPSGEKIARILSPVRSQRVRHPSASQRRKSPPLRGPALKSRTRPYRPPDASVVRAGEASESAMVAQFVPAAEIH